MGDRVGVEYRLTESYFGISGTVELETDKYANDPDREERKPATTEATVTLGVRADAAATCAVDFDTSGDNSYTVTRTIDERLSAVSFNTAGVGANVVSTAATAIAFVGSLAASVLGAPARMGVGGLSRATAGGRTIQGRREPTDDEKRERAAKQTPEERAYDAWRAGHADEAKAYDEYEGVVKRAKQKVLELRSEMIDVNSHGDLGKILTRVRRLEQVTRSGQAELDRIDSLYQAWRATTRKSRTQTYAYELEIKDLPPYAASQPPDPTNLSPEAKRVWDDLEVMVQVEELGNPLAKKPDEAQVRRHPLDPRIAQIVALVGETDYPIGPDIHNLIRWRIPRPVAIHVWRRNAKGDPVLERTMPALVVDAQSGVGAMAVDGRLFGENGGALTFGDLGAPTTLNEVEKGALGAFLDSLRGVPEGIVAGLESAQKADAAYAGLRDARDERELARRKRRLERAQTDLELKGVAATADDFGKVKRLQQQVEIAEAEGTLRPRSELQQKKEELELAKVNKALSDLAAGIPPDEAPPSLEDQLADLVGRVEALEVVGK